MSKKPSDATLLRTARREIKILQRLRDSLTISRGQCLERAVKAEQEAIDWRRRFDMLLIRTPVVEVQKNDAERLQRCFDLLRQDPDRNYVPAVKLHRELFNSDLKSAVQAIQPERDRLRGPVNG